MPTFRCKVGVPTKEQTDTGPPPVMQDVTTLTDVRLVNTAVSGYPNVSWTKADLIQYASDLGIVVPGGACKSEVYAIIQEAIHGDTC